MGEVDMDLQVHDDMVLHLVGVKVQDGTSY